MATSPSTDNYSLGKGVVYFNLKNAAGVYTGERDLGNAPAFTFNIALEKLDHFSSRGGLKAKDKVVVSQITPTVAFTLDEITKENVALLTMGEQNEVIQPAGSVSAEVITANLDRRSKLAFTEITFETLPYDTGTTIFVEGEVVSGAGGATGVVLAVTGDATAGTLTIAKTNTDPYVDGEVLSGSIAGDAAVNSLTGSIAGTGTPVVLVQDSTDTITYVAGTDYEINTVLKDDKIGRIKILDGGSIAAGDELHVTYQYRACTYTEVQALKQTLMEGELRFVSDNPVGAQQMVQIWRCSLTPTGDTSLIGESWSEIAISGEVLKDDVNHPDSPYMSITMD